MTLSTGGRGTCSSWHENAPLLRSASPSPPAALVGQSAAEWQRLGRQVRAGARSAHGLVSDYIAWRRSLSFGATPARRSATSRRCLDRSWTATSSSYGSPDERAASLRRVSSGGATSR